MTGCGLPTVTQVTQEELQTAMGFLKEQLGEDELRLMLDRLNDWNKDGAMPIDVGKLMHMASSAEPLTTALPAAAAPVAAPAAAALPNEDNRQRV